MPYIPLLLLCVFPNKKGESKRGSDTVNFTYATWAPAAKPRGAVKPASLATASSAKLPRGCSTSTPLITSYP